MEVTTYTIELTFAGQTKLVQLASASEDYWNSLEKQFRELFPTIGQEEAVTAKYFDEEGDLVTIDSNAELQEVLSQGKPLKIQLVCKKIGSSKEERLRREEKMLRKYGKLLSKEEKRQLREERKDERNAKKEHKRAAQEMGGPKPQEEGQTRRRLTPEERKELNEQRKKQRLEERQARNNSAEDDDNVDEWPADATHLFLDGNNMMFVTTKLRSLTLGRNRRQAEALLASVAKFFILSQPGKIKEATLIFDNTSTDEKMVIGKDTLFHICSARPKQPTSDDVLIAWAKQAKEEGRSSGMIFVTSDRALREQLKEAGGRLMKPKHWIRLSRSLALSVPSADNLSDSELDDWLSTL